jgi:hypoxanthine phosphoribosyltransferase
MIRTSYSDAWFNENNRRNVINTFANVIRDNVFQFDGIVARGVSGMLFGPILANQFNLKFIVARKKHELSAGNSHASFQLEGNYDIKKYVIVDDCISSGNTVLGIIADMHYGIPTAEYAGTFLWNDGSKRKYCFSPVYCSNESEKIYRKTVYEKLSLVLNYTITMVKLS